MTRKDYVAAAKIVREWKAACGKMQPSPAEAVQIAFEQLFREDNPRFNVQTFRKACEIPSKG